MLTITQQLVLASNHLLTKEPTMKSALELFANAGDGVFAVDRDQRIIYWSKLAAQTLGYSTKDAMGQPCWSLLKGQSIDGTPICCANCPIFQQIQNKTAVKPFNLIAKNHSGDFILLNISSIGLPDDAQKFAGLVHIQRES